jgi:hypothetical protein
MCGECSRGRRRAGLAGDGRPGFAGMLEWSMTSMLTNTQFTIPPKLYRIGEIVRFTGLSRQTIHNYTTMGLIQEAEWTPGGHRLYDESVFPRLRQIADLKGARSMQEIRQILESTDD